MKKTLKVTFSVFLSLAVCMIAGCPAQSSRQPLDPAMYPQEWPMPGITAMEGSTPTPLPLEWKNFYGDGFVFTEQSWSTPNIAIAMACGICFENPAGWETVLKDMKSKCSREKMEFRGVVDRAPKLKADCKHTAMWSYMGTTVTLYETTASTFILEVTHSEFLTKR